MAQLSFQIPDAHMPDLVEAWGRGRGWLASIPNPDNPEEMIPNPQTEQVYAKNTIKDEIIQQVKHYQGQQIDAIPIS